MKPSSYVRSSGKSKKRREERKIAYIHYRTIAVKRGNKQSLS